VVVQKIISGKKSYRKKGEWRKSLCGICPTGCWVEVCIKDGKLIDIKPDSGHPLGILCRLGQHAPEIIYSKHRLLYPMKREGKKGTYHFKRINWDDAYDTIAENINRIKAIDGPEAVSIYTGRGAQELSLCDMYKPRGIEVSSASNILFPFGSPNTSGVGALCYASLNIIAPQVTMGRMQTNMFSDIENTELIVVWGANPATDSPPSDLQRLETAAKRGATIIIIDPRCTETVSRTNGQWVPIRPGTDGALALSLIQVMIEDDLHNEDFAENWCHGFNELVTYVQHFRPEVVERITKVPADTIRKLAHRICKANGATVLMFTGLEYANSGVQSARAVLTLFALAGQLDVPGGIVLSMQNSMFPVNHSCNQGNPCLERAIGRKEFPIYSKYRGESHAIGLVNSVVKGEPYYTRALIIHGASLLTSWPQTSLWREMLSRLEFLVCIDRQLTADAAYADILLPATTMFENDSYMTYGPIFRLRQKVIEPLGESRNDYLIMAEMAKHLGYGDLYPQTEEEMIRLALEGSGFTLEDIKKANGWIKMATPMLEYKKWQKGGLRKDNKPGFDTPTGKFEIWSTILEDYGYEPLPKYIEPTEGPLANPALAEKFPLVFNSGARPNNDFRSQHHGIEGLVRETPEPIIELNTEDAKQKGIENGDLVEVHTLRGSVLFRAQVTHNIIKGTVECNMGGGSPVGPHAWQKWNVNELTDLNNYDAISGFPVYKSLLCDVVKVKGAARKKTVPSNSKGWKNDNATNLASPQKIRMDKEIYLDNNATTFLANEVREAMQPFWNFNHGNPSSIHNSGRKAHEDIENARRQVANLINTQPRRIIFTGGGSEADNLALKGVAFAIREKGNHIITTTIEHAAIINTCKFLDKVGYRITYLDVDEFGYVHPEKLKNAITGKTILVSIMMANNEVGTIEPIKELCAITHERGVLFHTDAIQAAGKIKIDATDLGVDMLSISAHKFHGPKGVGALYVSKGIRVEPLIHGGAQEGKLRAGTENISGIVGFGKAAEVSLNFLSNSGYIQMLRDKLESHIRKLIPGVRLNGHPVHRLPNTLNLTLPGLRGESIVIALDHYGIALSSGSACKSGSPEPSHVLIAMGKTTEEAHCSVRFTLSRYTTEYDINQAVLALGRVLQDKEIVRLVPCK
jgi:cysteine desulfurase NifS